MQTNCYGYQLGFSDGQLYGESKKGIHSFHFQFVHQLLVKLIFDKGKTLQ